MGNTGLNIDASVAMQKPIPLDLPSESILAWEHGAYSQTDYGGILLKGRCNIEAMMDAFRRAQLDRPTFRSNLIRVKRGLWEGYAWRISDRFNELDVRDFSHLESLPEDLDAWLHAQMAPHIETLQDLSVEFPIRLVLFVLPEGSSIIVLMMHHVATDGGGVYDFLRQVFRHYHRTVTGAEPEWADVPGLHAQVGKAEPVKPAGALDFLKFYIPQLIAYPAWKLVQFRSTPSAPRGRILVRHIIDDTALQKALRDRARKAGGTLTDLMVAGSKLAIEQWNQEHNAPYELMLHGIAVNQRLRRDPSETQGLGNPMSAIGIPSNPGHRRDPEFLLRYIIEQRKLRLALGHDITLAKITRFIMRASHLLPLDIRYRAIRPILDSKLTHFITNLGVIWPKTENGKFTGDSAIRQVGELELQGMYSCVGTTENNPQVLIVRSFLGRLYMDMSYGRWRVNEADAKGFSKLVYDKVLGYL